MKTLYLAGPRGFSELNKPGTELIEEILSKKFHVVNPFEETKTLGRKIDNLHQKLLESENPAPFSQIQQSLQGINYQIGEQNVASIREADLLLAVLDGSDVDSGTAAEIGFAFALGKTIWGIRGDLRWSGDNLGSRINLQVEYFLTASGGKILFSLADLRSWVELQ
ncbi:MAG: nucleoside 2-deoxyribosyltransferase [Promethearchaeota archaeon]